MASSVGGTTDVARSNLADLYQQLKKIDVEEELLDDQIDTNLFEQRVRKFEALNIPDTVLLEEHYEALTSLKRELDDLQSSVRTTINICSRPKVRPLTILDIPDETLVHIFGYLRGWEPDEYFFTEWSRGSRDIKNLRVTCRRFCNASSHLLIHFIRVEMHDPSSLLRLEEISRHSTISKGVCAVRVLLQFYDSVLANDILKFVEYNANKLRETTEWTEETASVDVSIFDIPKKQVLESIKKVKAILKTWDGFIDGTPADEDDLMHRKLESAHEEYRQRFMDQERQREGGTFIQAVASAIARMPFAKRLEFRDHDMFWGKPRKSYFDRANDYEVLFESMLLPIRWEEARIHGLGQAPAEMLFKLPQAIYKAGTLLTDISIEVSPPEDYAALVPSKEDRRDLKAAVQRLKIFEFNPRQLKDPGYWPPREPGEVKDLGRFLTALLDTDSIRRMSLNFDFLWDDSHGQSPPMFSLGPIITLRPWQKLYILHWGSVSLHLAELKQFIEQLNDPIMLMSMSDIHLLSGTWAEALDILRTKSTYYTGLERPSGAECDTMSDEEKKAIFAGPKPSYNSKSQAELYIQGQSRRNPLRNDVEQSSDTG